MKTFTLIGALLLSLSANAQFKLPQIPYDKVDVVRNNEEVIQKRVFLKGALVLEINYPDHEKGSMQGLCHRSNIVYDSIYIYYGSQRREITFSDRGIYSTAWAEGSLLTASESYTAAGVLLSKYQQVSVADPLNQEAPCSYDHFFIGEYVDFDKTGKITSSKSYTTGIQVPAVKETPELKKMVALKKVADDVVIHFFGKSFYTKNISSNYGKTKYHRMRNAYDKRIPEYASGTDWFFYPDKEVEFVDFVYNIRLNKDDYLPAIIVRINRDGKLMTDMVDAYRDNVCVTTGLISKPFSRVLSREEALRMAIKEGVPANNKLSVDVVWKPEKDTGPEGVYYYRVLYDPAREEGLGYTNVYFRERLVHAETGQVTPEREYAGGEAAMEMSGSHSESRNGKYGFFDQDHSRIVVPFEYDQLPYDLAKIMIARKDGKMGLIDNENKIIIPFDFKDVTFLKAGRYNRYANRYLLVQKDNGFGLYSADGKELLPPVYTQIKYEADEHFVAYRQDQTSVTFDMKTNTVSKP